jgi:DNA-binding NtrC family response regulator
MPTTAHPPTVLVVDDEPALLNLLGQVLEQHGIAVKLATSGDEAVELYARHRDEIDLVLLDARMPDIDGPQTLQALRRLRPGLRCCFMSGQSATCSANDLLALGALAFFPKPFKMAELARALREVLETAAEPTLSPAVPATVASRGGI